MNDLIPLVAISLPVIAILGGFSVAITAILTKAAARRHELELTHKQIATSAKDAEIKALREELAAFKDTSTQYDMTIEQAFQRIEHRITRLEQPEYRPNVNSSEAEPVQTVGRRF